MEHRYPSEQVETTNQQVNWTWVIQAEEEFMLEEEEEEDTLESEVSSPI